MTLRPLATSCAKDYKGHSLVQTSFTEPPNSHQWSVGCRGHVGLCPETADKPSSGQSSSGCCSCSRLSSWSLSPPSSPWSSAVFQHRVGYAPSDRQHWRRRQVGVAAAAVGLAEVVVVIVASLITVSSLSRPRWYGTQRLPINTQE